MLVRLLIKTKIYWRYWRQHEEHQSFRECVSYCVIFFNCSD